MPNSRELSTLKNTVLRERRYQLVSSHCSGHITLKMNYLKMNKLTGQKVVQNSHVLLLTCRVCKKINTKEKLIASSNSLIVSINKCLEVNRGYFEHFSHRILRFSISILLFHSPSNLKILVHFYHIT